MKTTIDVPDDLHRAVKARAALEGRSVRDVTIELYRRWLGELMTETGADAQAWLRSGLAPAPQRDAGSPDRTVRSTRGRPAPTTET
jgi:plasmid stability protein